MSLKVPFAKPYFSNRDIEEILDEIRTAMKSGWLTSGKYVEDLEKKFAAFVGSKHAVALNSCTAGLHATLLGLEIGPGDEVVVPDNTFVATANAVLYTGAKPVFADSQPDTYNMSPVDVEKKISPKTKAVIPVHLGGNPCDMKELSDIAEDHHLFLVEDCAHAHGAKYQGRNCGTFGAAGAFSFYATKIMTAGEGGIVTTDDGQLADRIRRIRNHGRGGYGPLEITDLGYNYRLPNIQAILGLNQLAHLPEFVELRRGVASFYDSILSAVPWVERQFVRAGNLCSYYVYIVRLRAQSPMDREQLMGKLMKRGIATSILYHPIHTQPFYSRIFNDEPDCPIAVDLGKTSFALPLFNGMTTAELDHMKSQLEEVLGPGIEQFASVN